MSAIDRAPAVLARLERATEHLARIGAGDVYALAGWVLEHQEVVGLASEQIDALVEEAKDRERLLVIASDYLSQHWDMDSAPLNEIAEAATQPKEANDDSD